MNTQELLSNIYKRLDYTKPYEQRKEIIQKIEDDYGEELNQAYEEYAIVVSHTMANNQILERINKVFEDMTNYLLHSSEKTTEDEYPFKDESALKDGVHETGYDIKHFANKIRSMDYEDKNVFKCKQSFETLTVKYVLDNMNKCSYIQNYIDFERNVVKIICDLQNQLTEKFNDEMSDENILKYKNKKTKIEYKYTPSDLMRLKKSVGYRRNNCIELNQDVIEMYKNYFRPFGSNTSDSGFEIGRRMEIDFTSFDEVRGLLLVCSLTDWSDEFEKMVLKLDNTISNIGLSDVENKVYTLLRQGKSVDEDYNNIKKQTYSQTEIAEILKIKQPNVNKTIVRISKKVCEYYNLI